MNECSRNRGCRRHDLLRLGGTDLARGRHRLVEVARCLAEDEVARLIRLPALDDRQVCAAAFSKRALRAELNFQLARQILPLELLVFADMGGGNLPRAQQLAKAFIVDAGIVGNNRQVLDAARLDRVDQPLQDTALPTRPLRLPTSKTSEAAP